MRTTNNVYIKQILPTGIGFGLVIEDGADTIIPPDVVKRYSLEEGETLEAVLAPNSRGNATQKAQVPWQVVQFLEPALDT
jgi:hypothetical protein